MDPIMTDILRGRRPAFEGHEIYSISRAQCRTLGKYKRAGFWSIAADPPCAHDEWIVVHILTSNRWFLCGTKEIKVVDTGRIGDENVNAQSHVITIDDSSPIWPLIERDKAEFALDRAQAEEYRRRGH